MNFLLPEEESRLSQPADAAAADQPAPTTFLLPDEQPVEQRATATLRNVMPINPEKAGEARRIANNTGMAEPVVDRNFDQAKTESRLRDLQGVLASSPILARQLTDPNFAKLAHDDVEQLSLTETLVNSLKRGVPALKQNIYALNVADMQRNVEAIDKFNARVAQGPFNSEQEVIDADPMGLRNITREERLALRERFAGRIGASVQGIVRNATDRAQYPLPPVVNEVMKSKTFGHAFDAMMTDPVKFVAAIGPESLLQSAPGLVAAIPATMYAGPGGGMAVMGLSSFATDYGSSIIDGMADEGVNINDINAINAAVKNPELMARVKESAARHAAVVGSFDALSAGIASKTLLPKAIATRLASKPIAKTAANLAVQTPVQAAMGAAGEAGGELAAGQELKPGEILAEAAGETFGTPGEVATMTAHKLRAQFHDKGNAVVAAQHDGAALEQLTKLAEASKLRERDPSGFQSFIDAAAEDGPVQNIQVSAATFAQAAGENLDAISQAMPSVREQMDEALASGGELVIPLGEFAAHIPGTGMETALLDHLRTSPDAMTRDEAKTFMQSQAEEFHKSAEQILGQQEFDTAHKESGDVVEHELLTQLNATNRFSPDANAVKAKLAAAFFRVYSARLGMTPEQMYVKYSLDVGAEGLAGGLDQSAYHGTPHQFDKFSIDKIGTGEGNQAYGHGLYFAGNKDVAEWYRKQLAGSAYSIEGKPIDPANPSHIAAGVVDNAGSREAAIEQLRQESTANYNTPEDRKTYQAALDLIESGAQLPKVEKGAGQLYHVDIPEDQHMLQWDKPLSEQPEMSAKLRKLLESDAVDQSALDDLGMSTRKELADFLLSPDLTGGEVYASLKDVFGSDKESSLNLNLEGIEGIKYLDGSSRGVDKNDVNHNYVIFNDNAVKILDKYHQENRGQISFAADITKTPSIIALLQTADLSTFEHELGHFYLEVLAHISSQPEAPVEITGDMQKVLDWFGVKDLATWQSMTLEQKRPYHEKLAEGFEDYLFEGNAPSIELQPVFSRIRAWMLHVYKALAGQHVQLTDEVRGVFDRLLATNDEILAAEAARGYSPLFNSAEEMGATQAEWKAYQEQNQGQTQEAVDQLGSRSLRDMRWVTNTRAKVMKSLQRDANSKRKAVKAEVAAEVRQQPVYSAQHFLKTGEMTGPDGEQIKVDKGAKLDNAALLEMYPEGMLARPDLTNLQGMTRTDGLHPDLVAQMFGFTSGDQMVRDFVAAEPEAAHVEAVTDQRMLERYGDLSSPEAISRATDEAIHNEARGRFLMTEANALAKAIGQTRILGKAAKAFAAQIIARKKIRDVKPAQYSAAEARAGKAAEKAKSLVEKATEKRNQIVNHHAARAAYEALAEVDKGLARFKRLDGNQSVDIAYRDQIDQLLERFDLRSGQTLKAIDKRTALAEWIKSQEAMGFEPTISDELRNEAFRKSYKDMTVEEFRGLVDAVKNIEHLGRLKKKLLTAKDNREFDTAVSDIATTIKENAKKTLPEQRASDRGFLVKMGSLFRSAVASHRKFASLVRGFDGYKDGGVAWENLVRNMNERGNFEAVENEKATMALTKLLSPVMKAGKLTQKQFFPDSGKSFTREERIGIALNMGNEVNRERVMSGEKLAPDQLESILNTLTKEDWNFVQGVWDYFDTFRPQIAAKERRITGTEPEWVEASPVHTIHGEYKGGYYPIAYDPLRSERSNADMNAEVARQVKQGLYTRAQTSRGHTKARSDSTGRPLRYDFGEVITRHVTQVVHDLAWHEYLVDANRLLASTEIENAVRDHYGVEVIQQLKNTLKDIAIGTMRTEEGAAFWNHLRYGTTIVGLAYNVFNTLQNLTGITQSMSRIGTKWVMKGAVHWAGDAVRFEGSIKQIHDMSDFMRLRAKTMQREINDIRNKVSGSDSKLQASYFYLQQKTQVMVDVPTWWGAYEKAMAEDEMTQDKAVALADQAVLDAQGSGQIKDQAGIMRGGAGLKLLTTFYSFFNTTFNLTAEAAGRTNFKKPGQVALFAADMVLLYTLPALLTTLLKAALMGDWDDEDKMAKKIAGDQISFALGTVIGLREASAGVQAAVGVGEGFGYTGPASLRFFSDLYNLGKQVHQGEADEPFWKSLNNVGGVLFHYPAGQLNRTAAGLNALLDGRTQNPLALVMGAPPKK